MVRRSQVAIIAVVMCRHECGIMELGLLVHCTMGSEVFTKGSQKFE